MTGKERVLDAINHKSGKVPVDFGSNAVTGMHVSIVQALRDHYGLEERPVKVIEPYQMLGEIDDELKQQIGIDVEGLFSPLSNWGFPLTDWKEWTTPWGQEVLVPGKFSVSTEGGATFIYPQGDRDSAPSGHMPEGGYFFDTIIRQNHFDENTIRVEDNLEEFTLFNNQDLQFYRDHKQWAANSDRAVLGSFPGAGLGDIALVPGPGLKDPRGIRDVTEWYMSMALRQDLLHEIFASQTDIALQNLQTYKDILGDSIQIVFTCGTDFGTQNSQFCSTVAFDELYLPYYRKVNDWIHSNTNWKVFKHSCGAVEGFLSHFIEAGFDIINPVQCSAAGMDPMTLKERYGKDITFWGGGVNTQHTLPFGTPEDVRKEVLERLEIFSRDGGYVFDAIHNVQAQTPIANVVAMLEAVQEFNA